METQISIAIAAVVGLLLGYGLARLTRQGPSAAEQQKTRAPDLKWWEVRKSLTGTQLQILQFMEAKKYATIGDLQTKFEFIPDRELYYRLEQVVLLRFVSRGREHGDVIYVLNPEYAATVEDDKTVMLSG